MKAKFTITPLFLIVFLFITGTSCDKKTDCIARITCLDSLGMPMPNAAVKLFANVKTPQGGTVTADLKADGITDDGGFVSFTFKLPAIYDIRATKGSLTGISIIKLEEGKVTEKTVVVRK